MTLDDGTPPPNAPAFLDDLSIDVEACTAEGDPALAFEPTQSLGLRSFVLADDEPPPAPVPPLEPAIKLAHPRLIPRAHVRTRFPRASSPMATPSIEMTGLPSPVAHPRGAPMFVALPPPRRR